MAIDQTVAIITRTKDRPLFLARCIESILSQDFQNWTHIIVNDGGDPANVVATTSRYLTTTNPALLSSTTKAI